MTLTAIDHRAALIVVDLQKGIVGLPTAHPADMVVKRSAALANAFRERGLPVVLVNVTGGAPGRTEQSRNLGDLPADWADIAPELGRQPTDHLVTKRTWGAFTNTDLKEYLNKLGITQVVITGIATGTGVEATARQAYEGGFNVTLVTDAMTDMRSEAHEYSIDNVFPRLGERGTTDEILGLLEKRIA